MNVSKVHDLTFSFKQVSKLVLLLIHSVLETLQNALSKDMLSVCTLKHDSFEMYYGVICVPDKHLTSAGKIW